MVRHRKRMDEFYDTVVLGAWPETPVLLRRLADGFQGFRGVDYLSPPVFSLCRERGDGQAPSKVEMEVQMRGAVRQPFATATRPRSNLIAACSAGLLLLTGLVMAQVVPPCAYPIDPIQA